MDSPTLRVMVFGEAGAGKTVYLAGLFRQMSVSRPGSVVTLDADLADRHALNQIYREVVSPELIEFPPSTHWGSKAWQFSCRITNRHGSFQPLSVEYLDYDGRMLDPMNGPLQMSAEDIAADDGLAELDGFRTNADVFLVLVDGLKLWHMLRGVPKYAGWLDNYLSERLQEIERGRDRRGARRPMHLVITKWDLLDGRMVNGEPVTLSTIAALIAEQPTFADHLATRAYENDGAPVRLIPVSVTGPFAAYDEGQDNVVKVPGRPVVPCNVEVPFYAILPDALQWEFDRLAEAPRGSTGDRAIRRLSHNADLLARARALSETAAAPLTTWLARRIAARRAGQTAFLPDAAAEFARVLTDQLGSYLDGREQLTRQRLESLQAEQRRRQQEVTNERSAFALALDSFATRLQEFADKNPGSVLEAPEVPA